MLGTQMNQGLAERPQAILFPAVCHYEQSRAPHAPGGAFAEDGTVLLVMMYAKNERDNVATADIQRAV